MPPVERTLATGSLVPHRRLEPVSAPPREAPAREIFLTCAWFGLATGLGEVAVVQARSWLDVRLTAEWLRMSRHYLWMMPAAELALLGSLGLILAVAARAWPGAVPRIALASACLYATATLFMASQVIHPLAALVLAVGLTARVVPKLADSAGRFRGYRNVSLPLLIGLAGAIAGVSSARREAAARSVAALPGAAKDAPNVLLLVLDTVRADHLSTYGWPRPTSPNLTRLAERGVRFEQARSTAPWTLPSHASLFTGRLPHELSVGDSRPLDAVHPTLAEALAARGYATAGFAGNTYYCNSRFGLDRGFSAYEDYVETTAVSVAEAVRCSEIGRRLLQLAGMAGLRPAIDHTHRRPAAEINDRLLGWLDARPDAGRPFFAFLNYFDAHDPYIVPPGFTKHLGTAPTTAADWDVLHTWTKTPKRQQPARELALGRDAYDDCIASMDEQLGRLLDELDRRGLLRETIVVVTADHGESLGEHQLFGHWKSLYRPELHVPLVIAGPGVDRPAVVRKPVSLRDVPATILDLTAAGAAAGALPGTSLAGCWNGGKAPNEPPVSEVRLPARDLRGRALSLAGPRAAIVAEGHVFIQNGDGREELYDLERDPAEAHNLAAPVEARDRVDGFRAALRQVVPEKAPIR